MKLSNVLQYNNVITQLLDDNKDLPVVTKFKLLGVLKKLEPHVSSFEVVKNEKIAEYGDKDDEGNYSITAESENFEKFRTDLESLFKQDVDVDIKISAKDLLSADIKSQYLVPLYDIIVEE